MLNNLQKFCARNFLAKSRIFKSLGLNSDGRIVVKVRLGDGRTCSLPWLGPGTSFQDFPGTSFQDFQVRHLALKVAEAATGKKSLNLHGREVDAVLSLPEFLVLIEQAGGAAKSIEHDKAWRAGQQARLERQGRSRQKSRMLVKFRKQAGELLKLMTLKELAEVLKEEQVKAIQNQ